MNLRVDKVREEDREQVEEIARETWKGHDYLPFVFDDWVKEGGFYCLRDEEGRIIALDKYTWHENKILWLEGYRVHPDYRGKGYGWRMAQEMSKIIGKLNYRAIRFMTSEANEVSIHIGEKMGFRPFARYHYLLMEREEMKGIYEGEGVMEERSLEDVMDFILNSEEYRLNRGQYLAMWTAHDITENLIRRELKEKRGFSVRRGGKISALLFLYPYAPTNTLSIAFLSGENEDVRTLLRFAISQALKGNYSRLTLKTASERMKALAEKEGMRESDIGMAILYEKKPDKPL